MGPPGVGKTALTTAIRSRLSEEDVRWVWCEHTANTPALLAALGDRDSLGRPPGSLIFFDAYEHLGDVGAHFFREVLPTLGRHLAIVLSSREPLPPKLRASLRGLHATIDLDVLSTTQAAELLEQMGVPSAQRSSLIKVTGGLPPRPGAGHGEAPTR